MPEPLVTSIRELDDRDSDGLHVRLLRNASDSQVWVDVRDARTGIASSVPVLPSDRAVEVFEQPFAYAAARGITIDAAGPEPVIESSRAAGVVAVRSASGFRRGRSPAEP